MATYIAGRYVLIPIYPLSYKEFLFFHSKTDSEKAFSEFIKYGGFPALKDFNSDISVNSYLEGIISTVLLKDVISKNNIRDTNLLQKIVLFITGNIGNIFSAKRICDFMKSQGRSAAVETIYNDLGYLEQALFLYKVPRYDLQGKRLLETLEKYYIADTGIKYHLLGYKDRDIAGLLENIVFLELLRRDYKVYISKLNDMEIDFVAEKNGERQYIQVCYLLQNEETTYREYKPLKIIKDNYPKLILSMDSLPVSNEDGIIRKNIREWLLEA